MSVIELKQKSLATYSDQNLLNSLLKILAVAGVLILIMASFSYLTDFFQKLMADSGSRDLQHQLELSEKIKTTEGMMFMIKRMYGEQVNWPPDEIKKYDSLVFSHDRYVAQYNKLAGLDSSTLRLGDSENQFGSNYEKNFLSQTNPKLPISANKKLARVKK